MFDDALYRAIAEEATGHRPELLTGGQRQLIALSVELATTRYAGLLAAAKAEVDPTTKLLAEISRLEKGLR